MEVQSRQSARERRALNENYKDLGSFENVVSIGFVARSEI